MKRTILWLLTLALLLTTVPFGMTASAEPLQLAIDGSNCSRGDGSLIVYTDEYGASTQTNQWGAEAVVNRNNRVTSIVKGNARIPDGGFVVSGHDNEQPGGKLMRTWIRENMEVGDYVYYDHRSSMITVSKTPIALTSPFFSFDNPADGVDIERGDDKMVLYTPAYGEKTGTNEYGYEVIVENGIITKLGGNNSVIPENGYVVSLHGSPARWMRLKMVKGMTVEYDPETLNTIFTYSAEGLQKAAAYSFDQAQKAIDDAKAAFVYADYTEASASLAAIRAEYEEVLDAYNADRNDNTFADACDRLIVEADTLSNALCDSYPVQYRGVWIRPSQKSASEVDAFVKKLHEASINFVSVEGWFENGVIMDVPKDSLFARHPSFRYDVLQAYVDACHKYGMECHLWMPIMNIGSFIHDGYDENTVPGQKPEWLSLNQMGMPYNKDGFMMIDPANQDARAYLLEFYQYLVTTYDIDGFEMDYIRYYPSSNEADFGYTEAAFQGFKEAYGYEDTPKYDRNADYWEDWCQYRRDCITEWVREIRAMLDREAPDVRLAADVAFPIEHAQNAIYQDFPKWLEEGTIDILHPMAYGDGYGDEIRHVVELGGARCMVVTGLGAHTDFLGAPELERQAREDNQYGAYGDCYFEASAYFADKIPAAVKDTVYRTEALPPFLDPDASVRAMLEYMVDRIDNVIAPLGGMSDAEITAVKEAAQTAKDNVSDGRMADTALNALHQAILTVGNENARQALLDDLYRTEQIACVKHDLHSVVTTGEPQSTSDGFPTALVIGIVAAVAVAAIGAVVFVLLKRPKKAKTEN